MTKGTKIFRITICILLGLTMLCSALSAAMVVLHIDRDVMETSRGFAVAGVEVTRSNEDDILGDGTVYYDSYANVLTFRNAEIEYDYSVIYSRVDLLVELVGENKFVMSGEQVPVIYASNHLESKDIVFFGEGALSIEFEGTCVSAMGIMAENVRIESDITINMPDCSNIANGIYSEGALTVAGGATVTVNNGTAKYATAVKARNTVTIDTASTLNVFAKPGTTDSCRGLNVGGSLIVWDDASVNVLVDDAAAQTSECINVAGLLSVGRDASVTASAKKIYGIECYGSVELNPGASISASTEGELADLLCYGAIVNYGATVNGEAEALGGVYNK